MPQMRTIDVGEISLRCAIEGDPASDAPLVILVHGFPESWYSWRHQLTPLAQAGYTACAIDVRGYGGSDKPEAIEDYALEKIVGAAWVIVSILKEPVMLVCLLLVAKGWCITRASLTSSEVAVSSTIVTCLYAAVIVQLAIPLEKKTL